ncbi:Hypothetical protein, putative [Bodo saltans]|uniref:Uncharacterized protein n=1 Tax=Bodo saltans TaxID=75058 RepID=A0A0S4KEC5_BODSA|nr:Hypothetical protein, putative [Bodo saltans]|eukprot:CUI13361.1 Hypothetical protein, putative [Bodo saltans]
MSASSSLRTSPTGRCLTGANGPTSLRGMVDALQQESLSIQRTAFNILSTSTSASVSNNNASNVTIQQDDVAYASLAIVRRFASLASVKRLVTDFSSVFSNNAQPGVSRTTVHSAAAGAALMEAATDALAIIVDSINTPTTTPTVGAGAGSKGGSTNSRPSITPPTTTTTAGRTLLSITSLSDGSAASVATLEIIASLIRVVLLNLLLASSSIDSSNPGSSNTGIGGCRGGSTQQQRGGGRGGSGNRREMPAHVDPSASASGPSSFLHNAASLGAFVATLVKVVVTFSTVGQLAVTTPRNLSAAASINQSAKIAEQEVRVLSLFLITGLAMQHAEAIIDAQSSLIATLFPPVTSLDSLFSTKGGTVGGSGAVSLRFPLLSPLLHDRVHRVRNAASIAICQLLNRLQPRLGLCAEPGPRDSKSFTSLSTGLGVIVRDLHSVLLRALTVTSKFSAAALSSSNSNNTSHHFAAAALPAFVTLSSSSHHVISCAGLINIASSMILVTPYSRCPDSQSSMLKVLQLPLLEEILSLSLLPSSSPSSSHSGGDVVAMCSLLSGAWRAKAFQQPLLAATGCHENIATATTEGGKTSAPAAKTSVPAKKGDAPATAASGTSVSPLQSLMTKYVDLLTELAATTTVIPSSVVDKPAATASTSAASNGGRSITTSPPALSGGGEYGGSSSRSSLSIDAMRALTHAARSFPQYISPSAAARILHLCTQLTQQYIAAGSDSSVAAANTSITAVSEMLRLLMHLCGLAWEAFGPSTSSSSKGDEVDDGTPAVGGSGDLLGNTAVAKPQTAAATLKQRAEVILSVYCPLLSSCTVSSSVRCLVYKCLGQIGDDAVFLCCSSLTSSSSGGGTSGKWGGGGAAGPTPSSSYQWRSVLLLPVTTTVGGASSIIDVQQTSCESLQFIAAVLHRAMSETDSFCRAEAMQTAGIWALKYPKSLGGAITTPSSSEGTVSSSCQPVTSSHVAALSLFTRLGRGRLVQDPDDDVRSKALFLLSNICAVCMELTEHRNNTAQRQPQSHVVEALDELLQQLCVITLDAVNTSYRLRSTRGLQAQSPASAIAGQAVRMIQYLLKSLDPDRLIDELPGHPEGVISCFLDLLQRFLRCPASVGLSVSGEEETVQVESGAPGGGASSKTGGGGLMGRSENNNASATARRNSNSSTSAAAAPSSSSAGGAGQLWDIKTRWNAAFALGEVLSVPHIYAADPPAARICVQTLILSIGHDSNYKVRTRAAIAFTKLIQHVVELSKRRWVIQVESSSTSSPSSASATSSSSRRPAATLFSMEEDAYRGDIQALIPDALDALCGALLSPSTTTAAAPGGTSVQTPPPPFREVKPFTDAVRGCYVVLLDAAPSTETFQLVLSKHKKMLLDERLLM